MNNDLRPMSISDDKGSPLPSRVRPRRIPAAGTSPGRMTGASAPRRTVEKTYGGMSKRNRLPVSGQEPPTLTAYERRRMERKVDAQ